MQSGLSVLLTDVPSPEGCGLDGRAGSMQDVEGTGGGWRKRLGFHGLTAGKCRAGQIYKKLCSIS